MKPLLFALRVVLCLCVASIAPTTLRADDSFGAPQLSCGGDGQPPCSEGGEVVDAIDVGAAKKWGCPGKNLYFTPHKGGQCWSCPSGYKRTLKPIHKGKGACTKRGWGNDKRSSRFVRSAFGCPAGQFHRKGRCLKCPDAGKVRGFLGINPKGRCTTRAGCQDGLGLQKAPPKVLTKIGPPFVAHCSDEAEGNAFKMLKALAKSEGQLNGELGRAASAFVKEAARSDALRRAIKDKDGRRVKRILESMRSYQRLKAAALADGRKSMTLGIVADVQVGVGANQEFGMALGLTEGTIRPYSTTGVSAGVSIGADAGFSVGLWRPTVSGLAGYGRGIATSAGGTVSVGGAAWFSYEPTTYQGSTVTVGAGVGAEIGELNSALTQLY